MADTTSRLPEALAALTSSAYRRFAVSLLFTSLGAQLLQTAILWQVYELSGSAVALGLTGLARAGPHMVLSLVGGVAADRLNRVRLVQSGQAINALLVCVLAGLTLTGSVEVWHLLLITVFNGGFSALTQPARTAVIPSLVPGERLVNAIALNATIMQSSQITGPALAGVAIGIVGLGAVYVLNGVFYFLAMIALFAIHVPRTREVSENIWRSFLDGLIFVRSKPAIISLLVLDLGETVLGSYRALLPILATSLGAGPGGYGLLSAAPGVGSVLGSAFILSLGDMRYKGLFAVFGVLAYCVALVILALSQWFALSALAAAMLGFTNSVQVVPRNSAIIAMSPDELRGRVEAFRSMLAGGGPPLGYTLSGVMAALLGAPVALAAGAFACAGVVVMVAVTRKELRDPDLGSAHQTVQSQPSLKDTGEVE
jgi:MFS family permease